MRDSTIVQDCSPLSMSIIWVGVIFRSDDRKITILHRFVTFIVESSATFSNSYIVANSQVLTSVTTTVET